MNLSSTQVRSLAHCGCEIRTDRLTRQLYATDASIYQVEPAAVAFPRTIAEAGALLRAAAESALPIIPRGAGTGLVGGALGEGIVVDLSRHLTLIDHLDLEAGTVRAGAGVVLDRLNAFLKPHGFRFGPDVATSSRATIGGMVANNSSGSHTLVYGTTADHVESMDILLADGSTENIGRRMPALAAHRELVDQVIQQNAAEIRRRMPDELRKRWPGYGIDRWLRQPGNLADILAGSEGTLAGILSTTLRIVPLPRRPILALLFFDSLSDSMQATVELLPLKPAAIEHIDRILFDQTRDQPAFQAARDLLELDQRPCESILIAEFFDPPDGLVDELRKVHGAGRMALLQEPSQINWVWALRKAGLSLLTGCAGPAKPVTGIEDTAVRPEDLPRYVQELRNLLVRLDLQACFYGHAASGLLHVRPVLDLHDADDLRKFRQIGDEVSALVRQFRGSLAGEHGVGIARTEFMVEQVGEELASVFREIKRCFDPHDRLNPGKVVPNGRFRFDADLRWGAGYQIELPFVPRLAFSAKDGSFVGNLEQCNGCGACRKQAPTMCPTFLATGDEILSTRGRANIIRAALDGRLGGGDPLLSEELNQGLQFCLACKACTVECPSNVNLSLLKAELQFARHQKGGLPLRARLVGSVDGLAAAASRMPAVANALLRRTWTRRLLKWTVGFSDRRPLPMFARERFDRWFRRRSAPAQRRSAPGARHTRVILWDDTFVRYYEPQIGRAAVAVLEAAGFSVALPEGRVCCGRPAFSQGRLDRVAALGRHNLKLFAEGYLPIVFLEPSCYSMFIEEYRELGLSGAEAVAERCFLLERFLEDSWRRDPERVAFRYQKETVAVHAHCHTKSLTDPSHLRRLAERLPGRQVTLLDTGCCGMAGAFGAVEANYDLSVAVAEPLLDQLRRLPEEAVVVASGTSCRQQIAHLTSRRPVHMAELLASALPPTEAKVRHTA